MAAPSLRHVYTPSHPSWSFDASANPPQPNPHSPAPLSSPFPSTSSPRLSSITRPTIDLPPSDSSLFDEPASQWPRKLLMVFLLQYASTAIAMPFEVGKTLLQVQWLPKDEVVYEEPRERDNDDDDDSASDASSNEPSYFHDLSPSPIRTPSRPTSRRPARTGTTPAGPSPRRPLHAVGIHPRPAWFLPPTPSADHGVWSMLRRVTRAKGEGFFTLWNGQLTSTLLDILTATLQPLLHTLLSALPLPLTSTYPNPYTPSPLPLLLSHTLTALLLLPLDHLRTHLILTPSRTLQPPSLPPRLHLPSLLSQYTNPHLLLPALLTSSLPPLLTLLPARLLPPHLLHPTRAPPLLRALFALLLSSASLLITLPLETVRRRLQAQTPLDLSSSSSIPPPPSQHPQPFRVPTRPTPYHGILDALYRIITEESPSSSSSSSSSSPKKKQDTWWASAMPGITQLYRGYGMGLAAGCVVFLLGFVGREGDEGGWAEL